MTENYTKQKKGFSPKTKVAAGALVCAALSAAASTLYFIAYHSGVYEKDLHHYQSGSALPIAFSLLFLLSAVVSFATALWVKGAAREDEPVLPDPSVSFGIFLVAFMFIGYFIASFYSLTPLPEEVGFGDVCTRLCPFIGLLSAVPFICDGSGRMRRTTLHRAATVLPVIWGSLLMFKYYFDLKEMPLNDPELILTDVSIAAVILFFLTESRRALVISSPFKNTAASFLTVFLTLPVAVARVILFKTDSFDIPLLMENILLASIGIFALIRIVNDAGAFDDSGTSEN